MTIIQKVNLKLRFVNKNAFKPISFPTHRGSTLRLLPAQSLEHDFGSQRNPLKALDFYAQFRSMLSVEWIDKPDVEKLKEENAEELDKINDHGKQALEGKADEEELEETKEDAETNEDTGEESDESEDSDEEGDEENAEYTREYLEELEWPALRKLAKDLGVASSKKDDIIDEILEMADEE